MGHRTSPMAESNIRLKKARKNPFLRSSKIKIRKVKNVIRKIKDKLYKLRKQRKNIFYISDKQAAHHKNCEERGLFCETLYIEDKPITGILDSGSEVTLLKLSDFEQLNVKHKIKTRSPRVSTVTQGMVKILGTFVLTVKTSDGMEEDLPFSIANYGYNIWGIDLLRNFETLMGFTKEKDMVQFGVSARLMLCEKVKVTAHNTTKDHSLFFCEKYKQNDETNLLVYQSSGEEKIFPPTIVCARKGFFRLPTMQDSPGKLSVVVEDMAGYATNEISSEELGKLYTQQIKLGKNENTTKINENLEFLSAFYEDQLCEECSPMLKCCILETSDRDSPLELSIVQEEVINQLPSIAANPTNEAKPQFKDFTEEDLHRLFEEYPEQIKTRLVKIFMRFKILARHPLDVGQTKEVFHVPLKGELPKLSQIYPMNIEDSRKLKDLLDFLIVYGIIEKCPPDKNFGSPVFLIARKDKAAIPRLVIDSRKYNSFVDSSTTCYMLGVYDVLKTRVASCRFISSLDIKNAYYSARYSQETLDSGYSQFICSHGAFRVKSCLTGSSLSPHIFNMYINKHMHTSIDGSPSYLHNVITHYDDICCFSENYQTEKEHMDIVELIVERISHSGLKISAEKSIFFRDTFKDPLPILGFEIFQNKLRVPEKRKLAIKEIQRPKTLKQAQSLLGNLTFIRNFLGVQVLDQMNVLSSKLNPFVWDDESEKAFSIIQRKLQDPELYLHYPKDGDIILLYSDASAYSAGGAVFSCDPDEWGLYTDTECEKGKEEGLKNKKLQQHCTHHRLNLKLLKEKMSLQELLLALNKYNNLKLGEKWEDVKNKLLEIMHILAPRFLFMIEGGVNFCQQNLTYHPKVFDTLVSKFKREEFGELSFLMAMESLSYLVTRRIHIVFATSTGVMKTPYTELGRSPPARNNPLWVWVDSNGEGEYLYGVCTLESRFENLVPSYINRRVMTDPSQIMKKLDKLSRDKKRTNPIFKIVSWFGRAWNPSFRNESIFIKETKALLELLNYSSDIITGKQCYALTDSLSTVKSVESRSSSYRQNIKLNKCVGELCQNFPQVRIVHIAGKSNIADMLSRLTAENENEFFMENVQALKVDLNGKEANIYQSPYEYYSALQETTKTVNLLRKSTLDVVFEPYLGENNQRKSYPPELVKKVEEGLNQDFEFVMGRILHRKTGLPVLPLKLYTIYAAYVHSLNNHRKSEVLEKIMKKNFYIQDWHAMREEIKKFRMSCLGCAVAKVRSSATFQGVLTATKPNELWLLDCLERAKNYNQLRSVYNSNMILVVVDVFSKFTMVYPLSSNKSTEVVHAFISFISMIGPPEKVLSDNGTIFHGHQLKQFYKENNITQLNSAPVNPKARSMVERAIRTLREDYRAVNELCNQDLIKIIAEIVYIKNRLPHFYEFSAYNIFFNTFSDTNPFSEEKGRFSRPVLPEEADKKREEELRNKFEKVKNEMFIEAKRRQERLNAKIKNPVCEGKFYLAKDLHAREGEQKNKRYYLPNVFLCINRNKSHILLSDLISGQLIRRSVHHLKEFKPELVSGLMLPEDIKKYLPLVQLDKFVPVKKEESSSIITRRKKKELEENELEDNDVWFDLLDDEGLGRLIRFEDE